jgi:uncharacterized delta-60 repeat protein
MRLKVSPTPSNTPTNTPSYTPTSTVCPGICFSGVGTNFLGLVNTISQDVFDPSKFTMTGRFSSLNGVSRNRMVRSYTDGEVDLSFNPGTSFGEAGIGGFPNEFVQQPDGKYVVVGSFTNFSGVSRNRIARINYNGTLDTSFVIGTGFTRETTFASLDTGGKILVCAFGNNQYSGTPVGMICRLNSNGSLDTTFSNNAIPGTSVNFITKVIKNSDGTYYVSGLFTQSGRFNLIKLNSDGTYASSDPFNTSGSGFNGSVNDFEILPDGKLICVGDFTIYNGINIRRGIIRLNSNGTRDTSFNNGGYSNYQYEVIVQGDKYISVGFAYFYSGIPINNITRINNNGTLDTTWNSANFTNGSEDQIQHLYQITGATNDAGYIFCGGFFDSYDGVLTSNIVKMDRNGYAVDCDPILVSPTPTPSQTRTPTPTNTSTPTQTQTNTSTQTQTPTNTSTPTQTQTPSPTSEAIPSPTTTSTPTETPTQTSTQGLTPTQTPTNTSTPTQTQTGTPQISSSPTETPTMTPTQTQTGTPQVSPSPTQTQTPSGELVTCIQVIDTVIAPVPQSGSNNFFGVNVALSPYPVTENVTVTGYIRDDGNPSNTYDFSITIIGGTESGETANNVLMTGPADTATIFVTGVTPTTVTYNGNSVYICGFEPECITYNVQGEGFCEYEDCNGTPLSFFCDTYCNISVCSNGVISSDMMVTEVGSC